jgi:hypothetical protein
MILLKNLFWPRSEKNNYLTDTTPYYFAAAHWKLRINKIQFLVYFFIGPHSDILVIIYEKCIFPYVSALFVCLFVAFII